MRWLMPAIGHRKTADENYRWIPVVRNRLRYVLGETPNARRKVRRMVSADPKPALRATAS